MSLDKTTADRELVSRLVSDLYGLNVLSSNQVGKAFERLFEQAEDLELDAPDFRLILTNFLARAVVVRDVFRVLGIGFWKCMWG